MKSYIGKMVKKGTSFQPATKRDLELYTLFQACLEEGVYIDVYMEVNDPNGTLAQLAKLHAMIRDLAAHTGETFNDMKLYVKDRAGLVTREANDIHIKSFKDCSKLELSLAIQACIGLGEEINCRVQ